MYCDMEGFAIISIHAPREGSDGPIQGAKGDPGQFQSTLPVRGATIVQCKTGIGMNFNPRSP